MNNLSPISEFIICLVTITLAYFIVPYIKSKLSQTQLDKLQKAVDIAVMAAEEAARSGLIPKNEKYDYAVKWLEDNKYKVDAQMIEAAVWELMNWCKDEVGKDG